MNEVIYKTGGLELLPEIKPLWKKLNMYHQENANHFLNALRINTFEKRYEKFYSDDIVIDIQIEIVIDSSINDIIGYCISVIDEDKVGELDSLYVDQIYLRSEQIDLHCESFPAFHKRSCRCEFAPRFRRLNPSLPAPAYLSTG